jgi:sugar-phosphatase
MALIVRCLKHFGLFDRFAAIHSAEFEPYAKPHPGVFLSAALTLGVAPTACLVFEDSAAGVLAAKSATMTVIAVPTSEDASRPEFALADLVLNSLDELTASWLDERFS